MWQIACAEKKVVVQPKPQQQHMNLQNKFQILADDEDELRIAYCGLLWLVVGNGGR